MFIINYLFNLMLLYFCKINIDSLSELNKSETEDFDCHQLFLSILLGCWLLIVNLNWLFLFQCDKKNMLNICVILKFTESDLINVLKNCWINDVNFLFWIAVSANLILIILFKFPFFVSFCIIRFMTLLNLIISLHEFYESVSEYQMAFKAARNDENK